MSPVRFEADLAPADVARLMKMAAERNPDSRGSVDILLRNLLGEIIRKALDEHDAKKATRGLCGFPDP